MIRTWFRRRRAFSVLVHTTGDETFQGVLVGEFRDGVALRHAKYHSGEGDVPLAGEVFIPRSRIAFVQVPA